MANNRSAIRHRASSRRAAVALRVTGALLLLAATSARAAAESGPDKVVLRPEGGSGRMILNGQILKYDGDVLRIRLNVGDRIQEFASSRVLRVETPQTEAHVRGLLRYRNERIDAAIKSLEEALDVESRPWVRRDIWALLVRCALRRGDSVSAGSWFLEMIGSDRSPRHFHVIPLVWRPPEDDAELKRTARDWMADSSEVAQLLGAAALLHDAQQGEDARGLLEDLAVSADVRVRLLARAQLWRLQLGERRLSSGELEFWRARIEEMPEPLRGGPYYLLGKAYLQRQDYERAAATLLWVPLVYDHDHQLAGRACLQAADALRRIGQKDEAATLYREIAQRFAETPFAPRAKAALKDLTGKAEGNS